jgi:hypothetical protein
MPLNVGDIVQTTYDYQMFSQRLMNVFSWRCVTAGTGPVTEVTQEIADYFSDTVTVGAPANRIKATISSDVEIIRVRAQVIHPIRYAYRFLDVHESGLKTGTKYCNTDVVFTRRGLLVGRSERANTYLPGTPTDVITDGQLIGGYQVQVFVNMQWTINQHTMPVSGAVLQPVIFHRRLGQSSEVIDLLVQPEARVMTRRTVGRGI